jgi:hypothetical protein
MCPIPNGFRDRAISGRAMSQAVSRWIPTAVARVPARFWSRAICGGQNGAGAGFLRVLRFTLPMFIPPNSPSSQSPGAGTTGQKWPTCLVDPVWTPPSTMRIKKIFRAISLYSTLYRWATRHVLTRAAKCIDVDGGIFGNVFNYVNCTNFVTW